MNIVEKIAASIERKELGKGGVEKLNFIYADLDTQNIIVDNARTPFAACAPLSSGTTVDVHNRFHERASFEIFFGDLMCQSLPDYDARKNEEIIHECKLRAYKWLASLADSSELKLISINSASRSYMQFDAIVTGYLLNVTIEEKAGYGIC